MRSPFLAILCVALIAVWFRTPRISEGLPFFYREDEAHHFNRIINMVKSGDLNPQYFHKPSLHFYLRIPVVGAAFLWGVREGHLRSVKEINTVDPFGVADYAFSASHPGIVKWNRAFSIVLSIGTLIFASLLAYELSGSLWIAFGSGLLGAVSPALIEESAVIGVDVLMACLCMATVYCCVRLYKNFSLSLLILSGLLAGLSVSSKYNALPIMIVPLLVCLVSRQVQITPLFLAISTPVVGFLLGSPFIVISIPLFLDQLAYEVWHYGVASHEGHFAEPGVQQALFYLNWLHSDALGPVATALGIVGLIALLFGNQKLNLCFIAFPLLFSLLMIIQRANFTRNMLVIVPFVAISSMYAFGSIVEKLPMRRPIRSALYLSFLLLLSFYPAHLALSERSALLERTDSRTIAQGWLQEINKPLSDTALAGQLQFPLSTLRLPGVSRIDISKSTLYSLFQDGFDRVVVPKGYQLSEEDLRVATISKIFAGTGESLRIVQNPNMEVYELRTPESTSQPAIMYTLKPSSQQGDGVNPCFQNTPDEPHCWINYRNSILKIDPGDIVHSGSENPLRIFQGALMSSWSGQQVTLSLPGWSRQIDLEAGKWQEVTLEIPATSLSGDGNIAVSMLHVHSPTTQGLSSDQRRLGVALKYLRPLS